MKNRLWWDRGSDAYQAAHGAALERAPLAWGVWRIPESELGVLGDVAGKDVLELGCGAAQWTLALLERGARAVGIDLSGRQLRHARALGSHLHARLPFVQGDAERLPLRSRTFDIVFCDHGATVFAAPERVIPEAARVLRAGGLFAFCMSTPIRDLCVDPAPGTVAPRLIADYFTLSRLEDAESVEYQLPYGAWIRLFRAHGFVVEDLIELQAPAGATTTYADYVPESWAHRWPAEHIWMVRKSG